MKNYLLFVLLVFSCATTKPTPIPIPPVPVPVEITVVDTLHKIYYKLDTLFNHFVLTDTVRGNGLGFVSVKDYGAVGDGIHDDSKAILDACNTCIQSPWICTHVYFPVGHYRADQSILLQNNGRFFTIGLDGAVSNKSASDQYLSEIIYTPKSGFALGIQLGRSIMIKNLSIIGQYKFPYTVQNNMIGILKFSDWIDSTITDIRYEPYAGLSIDPYGNASGSSGGTSDVTLEKSAIKNFMVGMVLSPSGQTSNAEMINIIDDDVEAVRVAIAICQDQSKEIHIDRFKCWASTHTILDGVTYGRGQGGGSVMINGMNIAGNVNELFNLNTDRFPLSAKDIYSESLFRIGNVGFGTGANFINAQIDFLSHAGWPAPDYIISGQANFYGGMLRYYDNSQSHRMNLSNFGGAMRDMTLNNKPIEVGLYGGGPFPMPIFDNVHIYYSGKTLLMPYEFITQLDRIVTFSVNKTDWTATISGLGYGLAAQVGDYILGAPCSTCRRYYDPYINPYNAATIQIGRVVAINGNTLSLDDVGINAETGFDAVYVDRVN